MLALRKLSWDGGLLEVRGGCPVGGGMLCRCCWKLSWDGDLLDEVSLEGERLEDRGSGGGGLDDEKRKIILRKS